MVDFEQQHSQTPHVHFLVVVLFLEYFRGHVLEGAAKGVSLSVLSGPAEVTQLDVQVLVQQNVFGLDISMHDSGVVHVLHGLANLSEKGLHLFAVEGGVFSEILEEIALRGVFEHQVDLVGLVEVVEESDYVLVGQLLVDGDFPFDCLELLLEVLFLHNVYDFDRKELLRGQVDCLEDVRKGALSESLAFATLNRKLTERRKFHIIVAALLRINYF